MVLNLILEPGCSGQLTSWTLRNTEIAKKFKQLVTKNWPLGFFHLRLKTRTENSKPCCTFARGANRYEVSLWTSYSRLCRHRLPMRFFIGIASSQLYRKEHQQTVFKNQCHVYASVPFTLSLLLRKSQTILHMRISTIARAYQPYSLASARD